MEKYKETVAIIGVGMMGGSIGLAVKKFKAPYRVIGIGRKKHRLNQALRLGACDEATTNFSEGLKKAGLVILCTPVSEIVNLVEKILPLVGPQTILCDIGSVKTPVVEGVKKILGSIHRIGGSKPYFVGCHPLAGSEKTGAQNAQPLLYKNATVVLCPIADDPLLKKAQMFWRSLGAKTLVMQPEVHDILVAQTSHLPHILASAYVQMIGRLQSQDPNASKLLAGSFKDTTRIVDADSSQWSEIVSANQKFIIGALKSYRELLNRLIKKTESMDSSQKEWLNFFSSARNQRKILLDS